MRRRRASGPRSRAHPPQAELAAEALWTEAHRSEGVAQVAPRERIYVRGLDAARRERLAGVGQLGAPGASAQRRATARAPPRASGPRPRPGSARRPPPEALSGGRGERVRGEGPRSGGSTIGVGSRGCTSKSRRALAEPSTTMSRRKPVGGFEANASLSSSGHPGRSRIPWTGRAPRRLGARITRLSITIESAIATWVWSRSSAVHAHSAGTERANSARGGAMAFVRLPADRGHHPVENLGDCAHVGGRVVLGVGPDHPRVDVGGPHRLACLASEREPGGMGRWTRRRRQLDRLAAPARRGRRARRRSPVGAATWPGCSVGVEAAGGSAQLLDVLGLGYCAAEHERRAVWPQQVDVARITPRPRRARRACTCGCRARASARGRPRRLRRPRRSGSSSRTQWIVDRSPLRDHARSSAWSRRGDRSTIRCGP